MFPQRPLPPSEGEKRCPKCGARKSRKDGFFRDSRRLDGRCVHCRDCMTEARKQREAAVVARRAAVAAGLGQVGTDLGARILTDRNGCRMFLAELGGER